MALPPVDLDAFQEAVDHFRARAPVTDHQYRQLDDRAKRKAFTVARVAQLEVVTQVWRAIDSALAQGTSFEDFQQAAGPALREAWGGDNPWHLETIFRTNVQQAYSAGRYAQLRDPDTLAVRPFWRLTVILDGRTSEICSALAGTTLPADDPFWNSHVPPLHFNCRTGIMSLTDAQADSYGVTQERPDTGAAKGFGLAPDQTEWQPDLSEYPPELAQEFGNK